MISYFKNPTILELIPLKVADFSVIATVKIVPGKNKNLGGKFRLVSHGGPFAPRIVRITGVVKGLERYLLMLLNVLYTFNNSLYIDLN